MKPELIDILVCPLTRTRLRYDEDAQELVSDEAGLAYPVRDGVPVMLVEEARRLAPPRDGEGAERSAVEGSGGTRATPKRREAR